MDVGDISVGNPNLKNSNYVPNIGSGSRLNFDMGGNPTSGNINALFAAPKQTSSILNMQ